jgi:hypothetical protein
MTDPQSSRLEEIEKNLNKATNLLVQTTSRTIECENNLPRLIETYLSDREIRSQLALDRTKQQAQIDALIEAQRNQQETISYILNIQQSHNERVEQLFTQIRGLQTENHRILDRLFGEEGQ